MGVKADDDARLRIGGTPGVVYVRVTRERLRRALLILDALFKEVERRGHALVEESHSSYDHHAGVAISIRGHRYPIELLEITDRIPLTEEEKERWRREHPLQLADAEGAAGDEREGERTLAAIAPGPRRGPPDLE